MEVVLLLFVFGFLLYIKNAIDAQFYRLDNQIKELKKSIETDKKTENSMFVHEKTVEKVAVTPPITVPKPTETPTPIEVSKPIEVIKPILVEENNEKIVFSMGEKNSPKPQPKPYVPQKSWWENFKEKNPDLEKFIGENIINKIGILILVLGISYFVKFAIDKNWINEPARVGIGVLFGSLILGFSNKLRQKYAAFSSVLVAGAIAVFYFTIAIAFHDYHLFNQTVAFAIMVVITAFSTIISLSYNRMELAVLSLIGGFAVPFMVSTGEGNYIVLFTYITILNIGILAIAYHKKWALINLLSYLFTIVLFGSWLVNDGVTKTPHYLGAFGFGFLFYFLFIIINIINNLRTKGQFSKTELSIVASNTFLFYGAGMYILDHFHPELKGLFTLSIALLNLFYAWFLYKKFGVDKTAVYLLIGQTFTFATLAIPIQFDGNHITLFWAAEGVLLMWLAQKSNFSSYRFGAVIVHFLMLISIIMDFDQIYYSNQILNIIINPAFITGLFAVASLFGIRYLIQNETENYTQFGFIFNPKKYSKYVTIVGFILGYFVGLFETSYQAYDYISNTTSASIVPVIYHLLFCAVFVFFLMKIRTAFNEKLISIFVIVNILVVVFVFSNVPFQEHIQFVSNQCKTHLAYYLHFFEILATLYFAYILFKVNKIKPVFSFLNNRIIIYLSAFLIVYLTSSELMLNSLVVSNANVTMQEAQNNPEFSVFGKRDIQLLYDLITDIKIESVRKQVIQTGFPILWGIVAFVFLIIGIKKKWKELRVIALLLLGLTIVKLFVYDIRNASETGKIIAFILLGVLILIISFVYQKLKVLVVDEKKEPSITTEKNENE